MLIADYGERAYETARGAMRKARLWHGRLQCAGCGRYHEHHLIVTHEATNDDSDRAQVANILPGEGNSRCRQTRSRWAKLNFERWASRSRTDRHLAIPPSTRAVHPALPGARLACGFSSLRGSVLAA